MKIKKTAVLLLVSGLFLVGCKETSNKQEEGTAKDTLTTNETASADKISGNMEKASFQIEGMSCAVGCASVIQGKLAKMDGVKSAKVDFESKTATVEFDNAKQTPTTLQEAVEKIANGAYKVENMTSSKETAMVFQEPKKEDKKACCSKGEKSCSKKEKGNEGKEKEKTTKNKEKKATKSA